jgi:hypothetical protein
MKQLSVALPSGYDPAVPQKILWLGCNQNMTEDAKSETKVKRAALRKVKGFVINGNGADKRFGDVWIETFDGGHSL